MVTEAQQQAPAPPQAQVVGPFYTRIPTAMQQSTIPYHPPYLVIRNNVLALHAVDTLVHGKPALAQQ